MKIHWLVAHTHVRKELFAKEQLLEQGFKVFLPQYEKIRRHARQEDKVIMPLFPRYLFVGLDPMCDRWSAINSTRGVSYLLKLGDDQPAVVPTHVIETIRVQQDEKGLISLGAVALFQPGDQVRVLEGGFKNYSAVYLSMDDQQRVQILLHFMKRQVKLTVPLQSIEAL